VFVVLLGFGGYEKPDAGGFWSNYLQEIATGFWLIRADRAWWS